MFSLSENDLGGLDERGSEKVGEIGRVYHGMVNGD